MSTYVDSSGRVTIPDPPLAITLFGTTRFAWLWLILRLFIGLQWLFAGVGKFSNPNWMNGTALQGFWTNAVSESANGTPVIAVDWYRGIIQFMLDNGWYTWFAPLLAAGETLIALGLVLGAFTGIAAFGGAFLNWNFVMAGTASTNAIMFAIAILLVLAWKVAGWIGLDRFLLPRLGVPWAHADADAVAPPSRT